MTALADLKPGQYFPIVARVFSVDPVAGMHFRLFGPGHVRIANVTFSPDGSITGNLFASPANINVSVLRSFSPVNIGDILSNDKTGETVVCRWTETRDDGAVLWSSAPSHKVIYTTDNWTVIGKSDLSPNNSNNQDVSVSPAVISALINVPAPVIGTV